ncbi:MAG: alpha/beta fold hydrolase [Defluviitaleaceae bacterium]|nr:alpha/beta fold hydrolase [Defluviitaleaceae bacterium]
MGTEINVIIHGFGGRVDDVQYLANHLHSRGLDVHTVPLAGHGGSRKDLLATSHTDWIQSAMAEVDRLAEQYDKINLIGFSMGGLIGLHLAAAHNVNKMVFVNTPIYFWNPKIIAADVLRLDKEKIAYYAASTRSTGPKPGINFLQMLVASKKILSSVDFPCLVLQCTHDEAVRPKSAAYLKEKLGEQTRVKHYNGGCHQVFVKATELRDEVCGDVYEFITE